MAQDRIVFRANTQTSVFPLLTQLSSQTVIVPETDQTFVPTLNPSEQVAPVDRGVPQLIYGHNIMPSTYGFQSIGYLQQYPAVDNSANLDNAYFVVTVERVRTYVAPDYTNRRTLFFLRQNGQWAVPSGAPTGLTTANRVSVATINGRSYICVSGVGTYTYSVNNNALTKVTLKSLTDANVRGVVTTHGYLITWSRTGVAWSSVNDPLDFEPSDVSGAGAGEIQDAQGDIVFCQQTAYGFIVYTTNNAVSVTYSGNTNYPFNFRAISAAGGIASSDLVSVESVGTQYAYTTAGMQQVYHTGGQTVLPAVTDFLAGQLLEDFNEATNTFQVWEFSSTMRKKIALIANRYLVCSYGRSATGPMTHAIVIDVVQSRMGKLKFTHNAAFELRNIAPESVETPRRSLALLEPSGRVSVVDFNTTSSSANGVAIYGKYQLLRQVGVELLSAELENIPSPNTLEIRSLMLDDGKNFAANEIGVLDTRRSQGLMARYLFQQSDAKSISILIKGRFNLNGLVLELVPGGDNY